jgi:hypothetical protein
MAGFFRVKVCPRDFIKHHAMKGNGGAEVQSHGFLMPAPIVSEKI